jgi:uncharacterized protein YndB with AHSA1/START domain
VPKTRLESVVSDMEISSNHTYRFPASRAAVWDALLDVSSYPRWWPWLRRFEAAGLDEGAVWRCAIRPPLPYALRCSVELTSVRPPALVVARIGGDIVGDARLELTELTEPAEPAGPVEPAEGPEPAGGRPFGATGDGTPAPAASATEARITSRLEARRLPARLLARLAPPAARWGHDWVFTTAAHQFALAALGVRGRRSEP